jgi:hypothetical protein
MSYSDLIRWALLISIWIIPGLVASMRKHPWASTIWGSVLSSRMHPELRHSMDPVNGLGMLADS